MRRYISVLLLIWFSLSANPILASNKSLLTFGVVPQQSASKLARLWTPIFNELSRQLGVKIVFRTAPDIPTFEKRLAAGEYDLAYMNPYHYTVFSQKPGYQAFAKARDKQIKGIIVVKKSSGIKNLTELKGHTLAFPSPAAFAASILTRAQFSQSEVPIEPKYVSSHDSVYQTVARGIYPAGGGVIRTLNNVKPEIKEQLTVLWTTRGYTPHAFAAHHRVDTQAVKKIQQAMIKLEQSKAGKQLLGGIKIKGIVAAENRDWDDVRSLQISLLDDLTR